MILTKEDQEAVMVTGGSGYVGSNLLKAISKRKLTAIAVYRHRIPEPDDMVFPVCSDLSNVELLAAPLRGVSVVIHLAWSGSFYSENRAVDRVNLGKPSTYTDNLAGFARLLAASEKAKIKRLVFLSAEGADKKSKNSFLLEKYLCEVLLLNSSIPEKIIIRSSLVYGRRRDGFVGALSTTMRIPGLCLVPEAPLTYSPLYIDDLTDTLMDSVLEKGNLSSRIISACGKENYSIKQLINCYAKRKGRGHSLVLGNKIGQALFPLLEKKKSNCGNTPGLSDYLSIGKEKSVKNSSVAVRTASSVSRSFEEGLSSDFECRTLLS